MARLTIPDEATFAEFTVVTSTTAFPISFSLFAKADLTVYVANVALDQSAFTFTGTVLDGGGYDGGTVTLNTPVTSGTVRIERNVAPARTSNFAPSASVPVGSVDLALNRLTAVQQDIRRRKVDLPVGARANLFHSYDANGVSQAVPGAIPSLPVTSFAATLLATANNSAFLAALGQIASVEIDFLNAGTGAVTRTLQAWLREREVSVKDFGALGDGVTDDTAAVQAAATAGHKSLYFPPGTYRLGPTGLLGAAGMSFKGAGRFTTFIKPIASMTAGQAIFYNQAAAPATSSFCTFEDMTFDLNSQNCVAIDLDRVSNSGPSRCHFKGGSTFATRVGVGLMYRASTGSGSYTNASNDCSYEALTKGVEYATGANSCSVFGGEFINCGIGADCGPAGVLDTPRIFGARFEGCDVSIRERSSGANYFGCRFEASVTADIDFIAGSDRPMVVGGYTATTPTPLRNLSNAFSPIIMAPDMGRYDLEASTAPKYSHGRQVFAARNTATPPTTPNLEYCALFHDIPMIRNQVAFEGVNAAGTNSVVIFSVDGSNRVTLSGLDRATGTYLRMFIGENWSVLGTGLDYAGVKVLGARKTGWAVDTGTPKRTANATYTAGATLTFGAAYVQAEQTAMATRMAAVEAALQDATQTIKALKDDFHSTAGHGAIGT